METAKKRLQFVDMAKGIAAICIVFYHILAPTAFSSVVTGITSGALFLFFVLSGYFYTPGKRSLKANIAGKAKALLIPFFGYSLSFWAVGTIYYLIVGTVPFIEGSMKSHGLDHIPCISTCFICSMHGSSAR